MTHNNLGSTPLLLDIASVGGWDALDNWDNRTWDINEMLYKGIVMKLGSWSESLSGFTATTMNYLANMHDATQFLKKSTVDLIGNVIRTA